MHFAETKQAWLQSAKHLVRAGVGYAGALIPPSFFQTPRIYLNLDTGYENRVGGVNRFTQQFRAALADHGIQSTLYTPAGCDAALVIVNSWGPSFVRLCRRLHVRSVLRVDGFYHPHIFGDAGAKYRLTPFLKNVNRRLRHDLEMFDHVIYQSVFSKQQADLYLYERKHDYSVIPNGVDTQFLVPSVHQHRKKLTLIAVGQHAPDNISLAFDVFEIVRQDMMCHLKIVGPFLRGAQATFEERLRKSSFPNDIDYHGVVGYQDLGKVLNEGDIFLHLKVGDWCPNAVLEALSCGLPVVCPEWGGTKELVGSAGIAAAGPAWRFDETLSTGMAYGVRQIVDRLPVYAARARERAVSEFDRSRMWTRYREVLLGAAT